METTGTIKVIYDTQIVSERFKKRDFVLTIDETTPYPQHVMMQIVQDKVSILDTIQVGSEVKVLFNLKGREWTNPQGEVKYFNTLDAWRIEILNANVSSHKNQPQTNAGRQDEPPIFTPQDGDDDLPF